MLRLVVQPQAVTGSPQPQRGEGFSHAVLFPRPFGERVRVRGKANALHQVS